MSDVAFDPFGSRAAGLNYGQRLTQLGGQYRAGNQMANGQPAQAAQALYQSGDLAGGRQIQGDMAAQQEAARTQETEARARQAQFTIQAVRALKNTPPEQRNQVFASMAPTLEMLGQTPQDIQAFGQALSSNPGVLDQAEQWAGNTLRELEFRNAGQDVLVLDKNTGEQVQRYQQSPQDYSLGNTRFDGDTNAPVAQGYVAPQVIQRDPEKDLIEITPGSTPSRVGGDAANVPALVQSIIPGARLTSGLRTPDQNERAGGARNSFHLRGQAVDIAPPAGMNLNEFRQQLAAQGVDIAELIDEGDHWHLAWNGGGQAPNIGRGETVQAGPRVLAQGTPQASEGGSAAILTPEEVAAAGLNPGGVYQRSRTGQISTVQAAPGAGRQGNPTEAQNKDSFNANRMTDSGAILARMEQEGFDYGASLATGGAFREDGRQYQAAAREWADSLLRLTTGAAATRDEVESALQSYFPQIGDSAAVRQQKAQRRAQVERDAQARGQGGRSARAPEAATGTRQRPRTNAPGLPFDITPAQLSRRQQIVQSGGSPSSALGSPQNPRYLNPADPNASFGNVRSGEYYVGPDGRVRGPKP